MSLTGNTLAFLMTREKLSIINLKVPPRTHAEFRIAAKLRGGTMSSLLHQYIVKIIREEKEREPDAFKTIDLKPLGDYEEQKGSPLTNEAETTQPKRVWAPVVKGSPIDPNWTAAQEAKEAAAKSAPPKRKAK